MGLLFGQKVLLTAEKVGIGPKLAKISGGVKPGHLEEGGGPKKAKMQYGVKSDAGQRTVRLDRAVEVSVGLRNRPSFRPVSVGTSSWSSF